MSTVLRPVGPMPPRVYWVRRGFLLLGVLILILVIAESCGGGGGSPSANGQHPNPNTSQTPAAPQACTKQDLALSLETDKQQYTIGESPNFSGVFTNNGPTACVMTFSKANEDWTVISGTTTIWTTNGCVPSSAKPKQKTIAPGLTKTVSITWDGKLYSKCQPSQDLSSGQYILKASLDGFTTKSGRVFQMTAPAGG